jgi:molybdate transport system substrate-binding protein
MAAVRSGLLLAAMATAVPASAAEINVIAAGAVRGVVGGIIDDYAKSSRHKFNFTVGPTGLLRETIASGKAADLIIASAPLMAELERAGKITPGSRVDIGRVGLDVVVRAGAPVPDVATPEAVKQALLKAASIAYSDPKLGATSTTHLMKIAEAFGIKDDVVRKGVPSTGGNDSAEKVANGKAEIAVVLISDIHAKEARVAGPLPDAIQLWTVYAAAIPASSKEPEHARAFVAALTGPAMRDRWTKAGWQAAPK